MWPHTDSTEIDDQGTDHAGGLFDHPEFDDHEHVSFFCDPPNGLRAIVAIHTTGAAGCAGGGCRIHPYPSTAAALRDALRLSRAMSYKLALFGLPAGGAKSVVIADPRRDKNEQLLRALGRAVDRLGGRYIVAEDVGTNTDDMAVIAKETPYVVQRSPDTSAVTGYGVFLGIRTAVRRRLGRDSLAGVSVAVQGAGNVGFHLGRYLVGEGASVVLTDLDDSRAARAAAELGVERCAPDAVYDVAADVFAPCALGDVLDDQTIPRLRCRIVAGGANDQLVLARHADELAARSVLYVPDFVINAGGILGAATALGMGNGDHRGHVFTECNAIVDVLENVLDRGEREGCTPHAAAIAIARERLQAARSS
jgi:leucine dehydrogenase